MARKQQNDPLRYAANLTALAAAVYLGVTALLRLAVGQLLRLFNKSATLENPIAVPEWVLGVFNVLLPAAGLAAAFWLLAVGVRATPMRLRISVQMPRDGRLWLFVPVFLGAGFLCSLLTTLLQRLLAAFTRYRAPEDTSHAMLLRVQAEKLADAQAVRGTVCSVNSKQGSIGVCTADGRVLAFYTGKSLTGQQGGVEPGDGVRVTYSGCISGESTRSAQLLSLEVTARKDANKSVVLGTVRAVSDTALTLAAADGRTLKFEAVPGKSFPEELKKGDTVRVSYTGWIEGEDTSEAVYASVSRAYA